LETHLHGGEVADEGRRATAGGLGAGDAVALHRAGPHTHAIGERDGGVLRHRANGEDEARSAAAGGIRHGRAFETSGAL